MAFDWLGGMGYPDLRIGLAQSGCYLSLEFEPIP
jgi:hypothetical protein